MLSNNAKTEFHYFYNLKINSICGCGPDCASGVRSLSLSLSLVTSACWPHMCPRAACAEVIGLPTEFAVAGMTLICRGRLLFPNKGKLPANL